MSHVQVPLVALVGRPNVGKSTLFNRLIGRKTALVYDQPGVTRDRIFGEVKMKDRMLRVVDTGGLDKDPEDPVLRHVHGQTQLAIEEADIVLLVVDAAAGVTPADVEVARMLRRTGKPTMLIANKIDTTGHESRIAELYELGIDPIMGVSAEHGRGIGELVEALVERLNPPTVTDFENDEMHQPLAVTAPPDEENLGSSHVVWKGGPICVAVVGKPNAGKSSLINRILGQERLLATDIAGTTRDPIDSRVEHDGQEFVFIDTAGIRRKRSITEHLEQVTVITSFKSIDRADVVLLVLDGAERPSEQDQRIATIAHEKGKGLIIIANKWDLIENPEWRTRFPDAVRHEMPWAAYAPIIMVSAKTGKRVDSLFEAIVACQKERHRRVTTGELNRFFKEVVERFPPPVRTGKRPKLYFASQPLVRPPTFIFAASRADDLHFSYIRYLENCLRERYGYAGTPLWLKFRAHREKK